MSDICRTLWGITKCDKIQAANVEVVDFITNQVKFNALAAPPFDATTSPGLYYDATSGLQVSDGTNWLTVTAS